jgi:hypothetical protein
MAFEDPPLTAGVNNSLDLFLPLAHGNRKARERNVFSQKGPYSKTDSVLSVLSFDFAQDSVCGHKEPR